MYSVLRCFIENNKYNLDLVKKEFDYYDPSLFDENSLYDDQISCSVCADGDWNLHYGTIINFINKYRDIFVKYRKKVYFVFDIAIELDDDHSEQSVTCLRIDADLIQLLDQCEILLEFSIY